ncbi:MAG: ParB N-terminal domain-containing protein [Neisseriaceae bacterium]|nr:ParB N-terminal domain-containing protein [Neisseriaceae bacterium]
MDIKPIAMPTGCEFVDINELVPFKRNPKKHEIDDINLIVKSVERNGWGDPLLVCPETKEILSGNGRYLAAKKIGLEMIPVVFAPEGLTEKQKADLVIASNKLVEVSGYNDNLQILIDMFELNPEDFGMQALENAVAEIDEEEPEVPFTEELREEHNYIVLYFDNDVDWLQAETLFGKYLTTKQALNSKEGFRKMGVGRVVRGADVLKDLGGN